jgi:hypothetical protein
MNILATPTGVTQLVAKLATINGQIVLRFTPCRRWAPNAQKRICCSRLLVLSKQAGTGLHGKKKDG